MSKPPESPTTIALPRSRTESSFRYDESLWHDELGRIMHLVFEHSVALEERRQRRTTHAKADRVGGRETRARRVPDELFSKPDELAIALYGTYGAGKSSLLSTLSDWLRADDMETEWVRLPRLHGEWSPLDIQSRTAKVYSLPVLNAATFPVKENFLYAFLARALEEDLGVRDWRGSQVLTTVQQAFEHVSEYLQAVDGLAQPTETDPLGVSLDKMDLHSSILRLQVRMREFIDALVDTLAGQSKSSLLLMPVDDVDLDPTILRSTLQTLKTYLRHPRLVPVFAFTGRIAEELLRRQFEDDLTLGDTTANRHLTEASTEITIPENLAVQYLGKLFPVRNRIKLSLASHRVHKSRYTTVRINAPNEEDEARRAEGRISKLLETASALLFGVPEWPLFPRIRTSLQSSTLRRQLQIVDAMCACNVEAYMKDEHRSGTARSRRRDWAEIFDRATWSLLNAHRDVLKEHQLYLDDLYSWTPSALRQLMTRSVLSRPPHKRRQLIEHWRYRTQDRRSQVLSLLAANVFRPRMHKNEDSLIEPANIGIPDTEGSFSMRKGLLWFIRLWTGFYLPLILSRNRELAATPQLVQSKQPTPPVAPNAELSGIGWSVHNGSEHAIREALLNGEVMSTGMMFLTVVADPAPRDEGAGIDAPSQSRTFDYREMIRSTSRALEPAKKGAGGAPDRDTASDRDTWSPLVLPIWCCHGNFRGQPWAAVSLWRGLGLLGQLIDADVRYWSEFFPEKPKESNSPGSSTYETPEMIDLRQNSVRRKMMERVLWSHIKSARVLTGKPTRAAAPWTVPDGETVEWPSRLLKKPIRLLADAIIRWLDRFDFIYHRIAPMEVATYIEKPERVPERMYWKKCFIRRMHGEYLMSTFWQRLDSGAFRMEQTSFWSARHALQKWLFELLHYWECGEDYHRDEVTHPHQIGIERNLTVAFLMECPFVTPFVPLLRRPIKDIDQALIATLDGQPENLTDIEEGRTGLMQIRDHVWDLQAYFNPDGNPVVVPRAWDHDELSDVPAFETLSGRVEVTRTAIDDYSTHTDRKRHEALVEAFTALNMAFAKEFEDKVTEPTGHGPPSEDRPKRVADARWVLRTAQHLDIARLDRRTVHDGRDER